MAVINGTPAGEPLSGTAGNDTITGAGGADTITMLGGNDLALWSLGDGSDIVEGGVGIDTARFSSTAGFFLVSGGSGGVFVADGAGGAATFVDVNDVERLEFFLSAFYNQITVGDLSGTDVTKVTIDFAGANDVATAFASSANNTLSVTAAGTTINVAGLSTLFAVTHADGSDAVVVHGADGNDKLSGAALGAGRIHLGLSGDDGNDSLTGSINDDGLDGGTGNDTVIGGRGNDNVVLGSGNDLFFWSGGDGSDTIDGGADFDIVRITGANSDESFSVSANTGGVTVGRTVGFDSSALHMEGVERLEIRALGGADSINLDKMTGSGVSVVAVDLAATVGGKTADTNIDRILVGPENSDDAIVLTLVGTKIMIGGLDAEVSIDHAGKTDVLQIIGGLGNDLIDASALPAGKISLELNGNSSSDTILGSAGNDRVLDVGGNDSLSLGSGNDVIDWGSGVDVIEGGAGVDLLRLSADGNSIALGANGGRALLTRNDGSSIDMDDVERIQFSGSGLHAASFQLNDLAGTGLQQVALDLDDSFGKPGNGLVDSIGISATAGNDKIGATISAGVVSVTGLASALTIAHAENSDILIINSLGGDDVIDMSKLPATALGTSPRGGAGNDTIIGSVNGDLMFGQEDNDRLTGGRGNDSVNPGLGDDLVIWNDGDGSDSIFDEDGTDTLRFTGSAANEAIQFTPGSGLFVLTRNVGDVILTAANIERIEMATLGGADTVNLGDLSSAGVTEVAIDLAATAGGKTADAVIDTVSIDGNSGDNSILLTIAGSKLVEVGLPTQLSIDHFGKTDVFVLHGAVGNDFIDASSIAAGKIGLRLFGDHGDDFIWSSAGDDVIEGGFGNDLAVLGAGNDVFNWFSNDGTDQVEGQGGTDTFNASGTGVGEGFLLLADGAKVQFHAQLESAVVDLNEVERFQVNAAGGADSILVDDLTGTGAKFVSVDLGVLGKSAGDGQTDVLTVEGGVANEAITATLVAGAVSIKGMAAQLSITHVEATDTIAIYGGEGKDTITVAAIPAKSGLFFLDGEEGNDTITGNLGNNVIYGSEGNDNLNGGGGNDTLYGGEGNDTITGGAGNDTIAYTGIIDGHDVVIGFDGNAAGGQDVLDLDALFDHLGVAAGNRANSVSIADKGVSVEISVDTNGDFVADLAIVTLKTADVITVGPDIFVGS